MSKIFFFITLIFLFTCFPVFSNQKSDHINIGHQKIKGTISPIKLNCKSYAIMGDKSPNLYFKKIGANLFPIPLSKNNDQNESDKIIKKINIFGDINFDWIKEKNRLEKIFLSIGVVSFAIGFSMLLAGLINYFVTFNAATIDGEPIATSRNTSFALIGIGSGMMTSSIPFVLVGSIRLGISKQKEKKDLTVNHF